ncbi:hypothetical protein FOC4_g10000005, partial [Fusarium odoratissimum]
SLAPSAGSEVSSWRLRRVSREVQPRRRTPGLLMRPTQGTGSHLLLQKDTAASSDEARTLIEYSSKSSNRERFHQIRRPFQGQLVLWKDMPSLLGNDDLRSTRDSPTVPIFCTSLLYTFCFFLCLSLTCFDQMRGVTAPLIWSGST